jgi:DNA-binding transcriptional regulator YiaG
MITAADVKRARKRRRETQEEFSHHFGVGRTTILNWERRLPRRGPSQALAERVLAELSEQASAAE